MKPHPSLIRRFFTDYPFLSDAGLLSVLTRPTELQAAEPAYFKKLRDELRPKAVVSGDIAIVPVSGILGRRPDLIDLLYFGMEDTEAILEEFSQIANNSEVRGILLDVDSPGGFLTGGPELADAVRRTSARKPVVAWTGGSMASLAYWIGSQASEVIASRSATVGSIGVFAGLYDYSKMFEEAGIKVELFKNAEADFKAIGFPGTTLSEPQRQHLQSSVQASFAEFRQAVRSARAGVPDDAMRGQTFTGKEAIGLSLVDRVGDRPFALGVLRKLIREKGSV